MHSVTRLATSLDVDNALQDSRSLTDSATGGTYAWQRNARCTTAAAASQSIRCGHGTSERRGMSRLQVIPGTRHRQQWYFCDFFTSTARSTALGRAPRRVEIGTVSLMYRRDLLLAVRKRKWKLRRDWKFCSIAGKLTISTTSGIFFPDHLQNLTNYCAPQSTNSSNFMKIHPTLFESSRQQAER